VEVGIGCSLKIAEIVSEAAGVEPGKRRATDLFSLRRTASDTEREMKAKLNRIRMRDLALFVVVAGVVATVAVFGAREAGLGERAGAGVDDTPTETGLPTQQQESVDEKATVALTLALTGPSRCQTKRGQSYGIDEAVYDNDGNYIRHEREFTAHRGVKEFPISWTVSGGTAPYTLSIDGASQDRSGRFTGVSGQGMVFCTNTTVESFIDYAGNRGLRADPMLDSGIKTVHAVVTDANGRTTEASIEVYVIFRVDGTLDAYGNDQVLRRGQTYRVAGHLITAPTTHDIHIAGTAERECPETLAQGERCEEEWGFGIVGLDAGVNLYRSDFAEANRWSESDGAVGADDSSTALVDSLLDDLVDSVGVPPGSNGGTP